MCRLGTVLFVSVVVVHGAASAKAEVCPDTSGERQSIDVLPGTSVRVMIFHRGAEPSYIEVCKGYAEKMRLVFAAVAEGGAWYKAINLPAEGGKFYVKNYAAKLVGPVQQKWTGMRRRPTPYGYTFN